MDLKFIFILVILPWECTAQDEGNQQQVSPGKTVADIEAATRSLLFICNEDEKLAQRHENRSKPISNASSR